MRVRILGSGTSSGVPRIGNDWGACDPNEPRNRRLRSSILVEHEGTQILIDTSPDLREQLLAADVAAVDAVIWTHDHADHCHGIDDLRQVYHVLRAPVRGYARAETLSVLTDRFRLCVRGSRWISAHDCCGGAARSTADRADRHRHGQSAARVNRVGWFAV